MLEMRVEFRSYEEWNSWFTRSRSSFKAWRNAILDDINQYGVVEPISGRHHDSQVININPDNLRESISVDGMNSRKRAGLLALEMARQNLPPQRRDHPRILGAEAITQAARILRGRFSYFLGAEYLPSQDEQERFYPIPNLDLMNAATIPNAAFDLFYSADVLEHVPDIDRALIEIARILRPGGTMVSTFPFLPSVQSTVRRASLDREGKVIHHLPPEYHGNPTHPSDGSLVFAVPSWDILEQAKAAGFATATMTLILSSTHGIVSAPIPGVFVMSARRL